MITITPTEEMLRGAVEWERTERGLRPHRLPAWVGELFPDPQLTLMEGQSSGVLVEFETTSRTIEMVTHPTRLGYRGADRPRGAVDLVVDGQYVATDRLTGGDLIEADLQTGETTFRTGASHTSAFADLPPGQKRVQLWLPHNESVEVVSLSTDSAVTAAPPIGRVWLHHGSSISHGSNATSPTRIWPAVAARQVGVELRNLGFGGSALVDPFIAQVMRDTPADVISVKLGINVVNLDLMRLRAFVPAVHGFLDTIRDGHPHTPLILISPIFCGIHEDTPGPGAVDPDTLGTDHVRFIATGDSSDHGRLTLRIIRDALATVVERRSSDPNLHYLDGTKLYGPEDADLHPLPDNLHPDTATHNLIGTRFADLAFAPNNPFAA